MIKRLLTEPVLHFLLIGVVLFFIFGRVSPSDGAQRIVISQAQIDDLARQFQATWQRPVSSDELQSVVNAFVHDEIIYREGLQLGLDRDDLIIKRRVKQKFELMSEELLAQQPPSDAELTAYIQANPDKFMQPAVVSFEQILFTTTSSSDDINRQINAARKALRGGAKPSSLGHSTLLPAREDGMAMDMVRREFGEQFADALTSLPVGEWTGPIASGFGAHLVRIGERTPPSLPTLEAIRATATREWEADRRKRALAEHYQRLRAQYVVEVNGKVLGAAP